jgi:hypothetical protein
MIISNISQQDGNMMEYDWKIHILLQDDYKSMYIQGLQLGSHSFDTARPSTT